MSYSVFSTGYNGLHSSQVGDQSRRTGREFILKHYGPDVSFHRCVCICICLHRWMLIANNAVLKDRNYLTRVASEGRLHWSQLFRYNHLQRGIFLSTHLTILWRGYFYFLLLQMRILRLPEVKGLAPGHRG